MLTGHQTVAVLEPQNWMRHIHISHPDLICLLYTFGVALQSENQGGYGKGKKNHPVSKMSLNIKKNDRRAEIRFKKKNEYLLEIQLGKQQIKINSK